jgi:hypothetical protein
MGVARADVLAIVPDLAACDRKAIAGEFEGDTGGTEFETAVLQSHAHIAKDEDVFLAALRRCGVLSGLTR